jgi:small subunit ribosomal protein S4
MREKQKVRRVYGILEKQFRKIFKLAASKRGVTSEVFFQNLELRLDNVVYRMGFASSRNEARHVVGHRHIRVNDKVINIPSATLKVGDIVSVNGNSQKISRFQLAGDHYDKRAALPWIDVDRSKMSGKIIALPQRDDIQLNVKERMIVELYSK